MTVSIARRTTLSLAGLAVAATALTWVAPAQATPVAATTTTMHSVQTHQSVPKIARDWAAAWNSTDPTLLARLFTSKGVYTDYAVGQTMTGRDQITGWKTNTDLLIADVNITIVEAFRSGDHVAIESIYAGHYKGAPHAFAVHGTTILDLDHGKIAANRDNYSLANILAQSGLPADWTPINS